jgi:Sec-independent protein translocase protein TatA
MYLFGVWCLVFGVWCLVFGAKNLKNVVTIKKALTHYISKML